MDAKPKSFFVVVAKQGKTLLVARQEITSKTIILIGKSQDTESTLQALQRRKQLDVLTEIKLPAQTTNLDLQNFLHGYDLQGSNGYTLLEDFVNLVNSKE